MRLISRKRRYGCVLETPSPDIAKRSRQAKGEIVRLIIQLAARDTNGLELEPEGASNDRWTIFASQEEKRGPKVGAF